MPAPESTGTHAPVGAEELFVTHGAFVRRFVFRLGIAPQDVDDVVQEVFLIAHRQGGYLPLGARPTTWLAEIALRVSLALRRSNRKRHWQSDVLEELRDAGPSPLDSLAATQSLKRVQRALDTLDLGHRAVFVLFELENEPCDAIAKALGVPTGTVHSRLHHARRAFKSAYDRLELVKQPRAVRQVGGGAA
jgi:RNA polymerase sigma-70 factor (ECF subfamily)